MRSLLCSGILLRTASRLALTKQNKNKKKIKRLATQSDTNAEVAQRCREIREWNGSKFAQLYHHGLADQQQQQSLLCVLLRAKQTVGRRRRKRRRESERRSCTNVGHKQTSVCASVLLSRVHPWASAQAVALAVRVSLARGIVQWRHRGRVLQRRPVALFTHPSEQDLCKLSGDSLHTQQQFVYC